MLSELSKGTKRTSIHSSKGMFLIPMVTLSQEIYVSNDHHQNHIYTFDRTGCRAVDRIEHLLVLSPSKWSVRHRLDIRKLVLNGCDEWIGKLDRSPFYKYVVNVSTGFNVK